MALDDSSPVFRRLKAAPDMLEKVIREPKGSLYHENLKIRSP
jgi:hypothetical protein